MRIMTQGYAFLDKQYFEFNKLNDFNLWIKKCKAEPHEICQWFFDEKKFNEMNDPSSIFPFNEEHHNNSNYIYLVNHRKLMNFIQFFYEWIIHGHDFIVDVDIAFILASSYRIFEENTILNIQDNLDNLRNQCFS